MVLHLLGKKSWNVYNRENVERVRRDEAQAKANEEAEEQRIQSLDAERRIALLRGEQPPPRNDGLPSDAHLSSSERDGGDRTRPKKRRRLKDEDDTARDIRQAREDVEAGEKAKSSLSRPVGDDAPLQDYAGNIQLFAAPDEKAIRKAHKNEEAEAEKARKQKRAEDQYTMRFSNAAGFERNLEKPWYADQSREVSLQLMPQKDVWGREDPQRQERERNRISSHDPFAAMQQAQQQLKRSERDKEAWKRQQQREIEQLDLKRSSHRRRHEARSRRPEGELDSLDGFSLDASKDDERDQHRKHHRRRRKNSTSRSRSPRRDHHHRHHSHSYRERNRPSSL